MGQVEDSHGSESRDQENDIKPTVVEMKLEVTQNLRSENKVCLLSQHLMNYNKVALYY